ncbi:MAG: DNA primase [Bacteroides sp.]|nr:DNA primase [Bacteroides sp.]MBD5364867.1 DNA primase [Bacteroides sp.]MBD5373814.1 DNA primase [Bacteroides sp.]
MQRIDNDTVRRILDTADIVEVVSDFVKLRRSGSGYMGLCPFHNERTPSFSVSKAKGICKCFSCGKGGSPVGFIMELEKLSYVEALKWLARKYNIEIKERELSPDELAAASERESMLALNEFALSFFERTLTETEEGRNIGLAYFRERGISDASIKKFRLGYAPEKRDALALEAMKKGYSAEMLKSTGLCSASERGTLYDKYRGRVIYPIFGLSGKVLGFGARTLKSDKGIAKYMNSPESIIYHKSNELYGLYQARRAIVTLDKCILVEGYMDVISMSQRGVENVVASSGTSLTDGQITLIHRFTSNVTVIYDSDPAGIKASIRGIDMLLAQGLNIKVMLLPEGDDPDSFAKAHTLEEIQQYMAENETDFIRFKARIMQSTTDTNDPVARAGIISSMAKSISVIPDPVIRSEYVKECARLLSTSEEIVSLQVAKFRNETLEKDGIKAKQTPEEKPAPVTDPTIQVRASRSQDQAAFVRPCEMEVLRLLVRYGMVTLATVQDSDGIERNLSAIDYARQELEGDEIEFINSDLAHLFQAIIDLQPQWDAELPAITEQAQAEARRFIDAEMVNLRSQALSMAELAKKGEKIEQQGADIQAEFINQAAEQFVARRLSQSPDNTVRSLATTLISEKYVLSKIYTKDNQKVETERDLLPTRVPRAIYGLKSARLQWDERELRNKLINNSGEVDTQEILQTLQNMRKIIAEIAKFLGERIILPK